MLEHGYSKIRWTHQEGLMSDDDDATTGEAVDALRDAQAVVPQVGADDAQRRRFYAKLFSTDSAAGLHLLVDALRNSPQAVNAVASRIAGEPLTFEVDQYRALRTAFFGDYYTPIQPINGDEDTAFEQFYNNLLANPNDRELAALRDLQRNVGDFWRTGTPTEAQILASLKVIGPRVAWDARHIFAFISLLTIDLQMKLLAPYEASGSIW
jgi:hypothetical protein